VTSRYREDPNDLALQVKELRERIRKLEQQTRAQSTSIRSGRLALVDSTPTMTDSSDGVGAGTRGRIGFDRYTAEDDEGYLFRVERAEGMGGENAVLITTVDGSIAAESFVPNVQFFDKKGGQTVVADAAGHRRGMSDPRLQVPWYRYPTELASSTSSTFAEFAACKWYAYHPHLRIELIVQNDASTVSEILVRDFDGNDYSFAEYDGGTNAHVVLPEIRREQLENDFDGVNGNPTYLIMELRRVSGAGTVRAMVTNIVAIDLSLFD
jgi:hypothetical protein